MQPVDLPKIPQSYWDAPWKMLNVEFTRLWVLIWLLNQETAKDH